MRRREFIGLIGGATVAWPIAVQAQQAERIRRVGILSQYREGDAEAQASIAAFQRALQDLGWKEGHNIQFDIRWAAGDPDKARAFAKELVGMTPDVMVPSSNLVTTIVQQETRTVPIVFILVGDPVGSGYVESMAHPGGNLTGFAVLEREIAGKWVDLLHEIAPQVSRVGFIFHPETSANVGLLRAAESAARSGVKVVPLGVHDRMEIERIVTAFATQPGGGLIAAPHAVTFANRDFIVDLAERLRLPAVYAFRDFVSHGGLVSYGTNPVELWRQGASYVDRILKGERPAELPALFPTKYELVVNIKIAKALGLNVPQNLLVRADEVIE